ncbi:MAG TPA: 16S rRNA (uracil(1498)-N(3))-methyltransferase [Burkholderiales bacterium]|jgi:16S rRNA (uracil1498-N3)-methyltransferase|nr:16S rRNA (uracil(1498)-N(3))-methyltransferase [Burkholderiales bacterium]
MVPRFHLDAPLRAGGVCTLSEDAAHHAVHVLRLREGDEVTLFNGRGGEFAARIASMQRLRISIDLLQHRAMERESPLRITLVQGVSAGERMDSTVRKAVELGVAEVQPVLAARSVARPKGDRAENRRSHWQKIVIAACEQCGRNRVPEVQALVSLDDYQPASGTTKILLSPASELPLSKLSTADNRIVLAAGPEAGFTEEEEARLVQAGFVPTSLGPRVLRTETAAVAALAALNALRGDS